MRYLVSARVRPEKRAELLSALNEARFSQGFPFGDLGAVLAEGRVDPSGIIRWVEVCYCREYSGVAMEAEVPYFEEYLTDITIADARSPEFCEGYPVCNDCDCTRKVRFKGEAFLDYLKRITETTESPATSQPGSATRWLGWRGSVTSQEQARNQPEP
jgi:hypothetical protein